MSIIIEEICHRGQGQLTYVRIRSLRKYRIFEEISTCSDCYNISGFCVWDRVSTCTMASITRVQWGGSTGAPQNGRGNLCAAKATAHK